MLIHNLTFNTISLQHFRKMRTFLSLCRWQKTHNKAAKTWKPQNTAVHQVTIQNPTGEVYEFTPPPAPLPNQRLLANWRTENKAVVLNKKSAIDGIWKGGQSVWEGRGSWTCSAVKLISQTRGWKASLLGGSSHPGVDGVSLSYHMCFSHFSVILTLWWTTAQMVRICSNYEG